MLKKAERLSRTAFAAYFKQGRRVHGEHLSIVYVPHHQLHVAVVVSKKVSKMAVTRNTIRRRIYARFMVCKLQGQTGVFIVLVKPGAAGLTRRTLAAATDELIGRIVKPA